jgi:phosphatidylserine/phosphatidylglycerophosphate/cardiolipin synthase-like enzyme
MPGGVDTRWLDEANAADLDALAGALEDGRLDASFSAASLQQVGLKAEAALLLAGLQKLEGGIPPAGLAWMLRRLARERRQAGDKLSRVAQLVWSGPSEGHEPTRDTRLVLAEIFARAEHHVLVSTFVVYNGPSVFAPLAARMKERPDLVVDFFVNLPSKTGTDEDEAADVAAFVDAFERAQWPRGTRLPALYYDPQTRKNGPKHVSLHAKCVVVDGRWAFVTSANFTEAAQARNIEAGVLLEHPGLAGALAGRFRALREGGWLREMNAAKG